VSFDEQFDVVSVGGGAGGLAAAITAASDGATALVLEKGSKLGGVTALSQGEVWVGGSYLERELGIADSRQETLEYLDHLSAGLGDAELRSAFVTSSNEALEFLQDKADLTLGVVRGRPDYYYPHAPGSKDEGRYLEVEPFDARELGELEDLALISPHGLAYLTQKEQFAAGGDRDVIGKLVAAHIENHELCGGSGLSARLLHAAANAGVALRVNRPVVRLLTESDRVVGVEVWTDDGPCRIGASAVLLATGGYDWNADLVRSFEHLPELRSMVPPTVTGDHMIMAGEVGAMIAARPPVLTPLLSGMQIPGEELEGQPLFRFAFAGQPHAIYVNRAGQRFADESFLSGVDAAQAVFDGNNIDYPNQPTWLVFDQTFRETYAVGPIPPEEPLPDGLAVTGDTLTELGERAGIDAGGLEETVRRFNEFCERGVDEDFGRGTQAWGLATFGDKRMPNPVLGALAKPPYYAILLTRVGMGIPSAGLKIDSKSRVLNTRGEPIPGLYAAGNAAAQIDVITYQSGIGNARGLTYGYLAAKNLVAASV
jgi:3-oxosteroid 1-dehydrogenase